MTGLDGNADVQLLDHTGALVQQSANTGTLSETINVASLDAGIYYIRVFQGSGSSANYTLSVQAQSTEQTNIVWRNYSSGQNAVWQMNGVSFSTSTSTTVSDTNYKIEGIGDFNGDGQADLVWHNAVTGQVVLWKMNGTSLTTTVSLPSVSGSTWSIASVNDFNGDGHPDILWRDASSTGRNIIWLMNGVSFSSAIELNAAGGTNWKIVGTADFDGDLQTDILWRDYSSGRDVLWLMNGTVRSTYAELTQLTDTNWEIVGISDFSGDGQNDILWRNNTNGQNLLWQMNGAALNTTINLPNPTDLNLRIAGIDDFNGDGQTDILWRNYSNGQNYIWQMNGVSLATAITIAAVTDTNWKIIAPISEYGTPPTIDAFGSATNPFVIGTVTNDQGAYSNAINSTNDDYYRFTLPTASHLTLTLSGLTSGTLSLTSSNNSTLTGTGTGTQTINSNLTSGVYTIHVAQTGSAATWYTLNLTADTLAPTLTAHLANDTAPGGVNTDTITSDPTISGQISADRSIASLTAGFGSTSSQNFVDITAALQAGNSFSLSRNLLQQIAGVTSLVDGTYILHLLAKDGYNKLSSITDVAFTLDTSTAAPTNVRLITSSDSGQSHSDGITNIATPTLAGNAESGATVKIYSNGQVIAQTSVGTDGTWQITTPTLADSIYYLSATATDVAGNVSSASNTLSLTIDAAAPTLSVSSLSNNATLSDNARLTGSANGTGSAITSVSYYFDTLAVGQSPISVPVQADGSFDSAINFAGISNGSHTLTVKAIDQAGNEITLPSYSVTVNRDLSAPTIAAELANDTVANGYTDTDGMTSDPTISGMVTGSSQITGLRAGFDTTPTANFTDITPQLQADGSFTLSQTQLAAIYGGTLPQGSHTLHLQAEAGQGNLSNLFDLTFNLDTQAPTAPGNLSWTSVGTTAVTLSGSAEAGAQVDVFEGNDLVAEAYADATGNWRVTTSQLRNGTHSLTATATDLAGNTSPTSTATSLTINTLVPGMPQGLHLTTITDSGQSHSDNLTSNSTPTLVGTAEAGATIRLLRGQQLLGQTTADATGAWSVAITAALAPGDNLLSAIAHNANGDSQTAMLTVTVDATAPTAQVKTLAAGSSSQVALANGATLTAGTQLTGLVNGTGSAIASLHYQLGNLSEVTVPVAENGLFIQSLDFGGLSGTQTLSLTFIDAAGNSTTQSYSVTLDTTGTGVSTGPVLLAQLTQDTGTADGGWTYVPGVAGVVSNLAQVTKLSATFDASSTAVFQDLTSLLHSDGTFSLDESQLAALMDDELTDGEYTLRLQVQTTSNQTIEQSVHFKLDRTTPETALPDVIDGIAWDRGMHLQGTVQDNSNNVQLAYTIERASDGQSVAQHSFTVAGSPSGTPFDQAISELAAGDATLQPEEVYNLILTSTDVAGNAQRTSFQFFVPGDRRVTDDDTWTSPTNPNVPPTDSRTPDPNVPPTSGNLNTWGYVGEGGSWGYYGGSGSGGGWTPGYDGGLNPNDKDAQKGPSGSGYEYEYAEGINAIVNQAVDFISTAPDTIHQKGALNNRRAILLEIGRRLNDLIQADGVYTNDKTLIERMRPAMEGLFADAYDPSGVTAGVFESFVPWDGAWLAQQLVKDSLSTSSPLSVREQVFQATLLEVVTEVFNAKQFTVTQTQQEDLTTAVMDLAKTYAWLNPNPEATVPADGEAFGFLDLLWRLQVPDANGQFKGSGDIAAALQKGVSELGQLLDGVQDPVRAIQFINNLMQAAVKVPSLKNDLKDAHFLRELMEFGVEIVKNNPAAIANEGNQNNFIESLWQNGNQKVAQGGLQELFRELETSEKRLETLEFGQKVLSALKSVPALQNQIRDPGFMTAQLAFASGYVDSISAQNDSNTTEQFLSDLWEAQNDQEIQAVAQRLQTTLTSESINVPTYKPFYSFRVHDDYLSAQNYLDTPLLANAPLLIASASETQLPLRLGYPVIPSSSDDKKIPLSSYFKHYEILPGGTDGEVDDLKINDLTAKAGQQSVYVIDSDPDGKVAWTTFNTPNDQYSQIVVRRSDGSLSVFEGNEPVVIRAGDSIFLPAVTDTEANVLRKELTALRNNAWGAWHQIADFISGAVYQYFYDVAPGSALEMWNLVDPLGAANRTQIIQGAEAQFLPQSTWFLIGQTVGSGAAIIQGLQEILTGVESIIGGGELFAWGPVGAAVGTGAIAVGATAIAHGAAVVGSGAGNLLENLQKAFNQIKSGDEISGTPGIGGSGLSSQQIAEVEKYNSTIKDFDRRIDQAENLQDIDTATELRWERYQYRKEFERNVLGENGKPLSYEQWLEKKQLLNESTSRGIQDEAEAIDNLGLVNNNRLTDDQRITFDSKKYGGTVPDSVTDKAWVEFKSIETSNTKNGKVETLYDSPQFKAQREGAGLDGNKPNNNKESVVVLTGSPRNLLRPSGPLATESDFVLYFDKMEKKWFLWDTDVPGEIKWSERPLDQIKSIVGKPMN